MSSGTALAAAGLDPEKGSTCIAENLIAQMYMPCAVRVHLPSFSLSLVLVSRTRRFFVDVSLQLSMSVTPTEISHIFLFFLIEPFTGSLPSTMTINTDPSTQQHAIVVVCIVSPIVSSLFVAIRVWTRTFVTHSIGWDDCKLPRPCFLVASLSHVIDTALLTWVRISLR